jgi:hypothetical protein
VFGEVKDMHKGVDNARGERELEWLNKFSVGKKNM